MIEPRVRALLFGWAHLLFAALIAVPGARGVGAQERAGVQERPAAFVDAATVVPRLIVEMRYAGSHNFVGRPIDGYEAPIVC